MSSKVIFIVGLTATGKTKLAIETARELNGELINCDSRQVYKYLDIGTNKGEIKTIGNNKFVEDIPIKLIDFLEPNDSYSVYDFKRDAIACIKDIHSRNKVAIVVGGTGLYVDCLIKNYQLQTQANAELRSAFASLNTIELQEKLNQINPTALDKLNNSDKNNPRRLIRLIEKLSESNLDNKLTAEFDFNFDYQLFFKDYNPNLLDSILDSRVEQMFKDGLIEEVKKVLDLGFSKDSVSLKSLGYKEVLMHLDNKINLRQCIDLVKIAHRQYAKRQRTWFLGEGRDYKLIKVNSVDDIKSSLCV